MMNFKYSLLVLIFVLSFGFVASAQQQNIDVTEAETTVIFEDQFIKIEGTLTGCDNQTSGINNSYVMLKLTNLTQNTRTFKIQQDLFYDGTCLTCGKDEYLFSYTLAPSEVKVGKCFESDQSMRLYHHMPANLSPVVLTDYQLHVTHL
jgi:predicted nucleic-acid-binding Zn-ribbon protein